MTGDDSMISVRDVHKRFGAQVVLDGLNLEIGPGEIAAIVGPSGVGKSVLAKLIMGLMKPEAGEVFLCGENITTADTESERNRIRSKLGVLFQSAALFDSLTTYDNVAFPLRIAGDLNRHEIHEKVVDVLESLSLEGIAQKYPQEISMGVRKRVGMARALITEPEVFIFDEPNTGLDPMDGQEVYDLINECRERWGFAGLVISHELPEVFQVSDNVAMILGGKIVAEGSPDEFARSEDPAVMQFINGRTDGPITIQ